MKYFYGLLLCSMVFYLHCAQDPILVPQVAIAQSSLDDIIAHANLDPIIAQALTDEVNNISQQANANLQQNMQEVQIATALTTLMQTIQTMAKSNPSLSSYSSLFSSLKYAAHANSVQKLLTGAYPEKFQNQLYYTNPYTENIGFIINDYIFDEILTALITVIAPTTFGKALGLNSNTFSKSFATAILAGLVAQCAWLLEKKFLVLPFLQQLQNNTDTQNS
ncbi:MAG TPA: hypothetical protein VHX42_03815 [Candidatus Babeliales bacterium]|jgi:hypothetical protein|nr:hypothetical protein [Candidatus Babeliales bacterium]